MLLLAKMHVSFSRKEKKKKRLIFSTNNQVVKNCPAFDFSAEVELAEFMASLQDDVEHEDDPLLDTARELERMSLAEGESLPKEECPTRKTPAKTQSAGQTIDPVETNGQSKTSIKQKHRRMREKKQRIGREQPTHLTGMTFETEFDHLSRDNRKKNQFRAKRNQDRQRRCILEETNLKVRARKRAAQSEIFSAEVNALEDFESVRTGWAGTESDGIRFKDTYTLEELMNMGLKVVDWDGMQVNDMFFSC